MSTFQQTFQVTGMTCGHCVAAVEEEVGAIADVTHVAVDLASGTRHGRQRPRGHRPPRWPPPSTRPATSSPPDQHAPQQHPKTEEPR